MAATSPQRPAARRGRAHDPAGHRPADRQLERFTDDERVQLCALLGRSPALTTDRELVHDLAEIMDRPPRVDPPPRWPLSTLTGNRH